MSHAKSDPEGPHYESLLLNLRQPLAFKGSFPGAGTCEQNIPPKSIPWGVNTLEGRLFSFKCCSMLIPSELIFKSFFDWHGNGNENRTRYLLIAVYKRNRDKFIGNIRLNAPYFLEQLHPFPNH